MIGAFKEKGTLLGLSDLCRCGADMPKFVVEDFFGEKNFFVSESPY